MKAFLEAMQKGFICLRCGKCYISFGVRLLDGSNEPDGQPCLFLIHRKKEGDKWIQASCQIHDSSDYPDEDRVFALDGITYIQDYSKSVILF